MEQKNYFAVIPASVRYDKRLKPLARLLYGEITALCNEKGYCWASNSYFAELYETTNETISRYISQLKEYGYIKIYYNEAEENIEKRKIYITEIQYCQNDQGGIDQTIKTVLTERSRGYCSNDQGGIDQTIKHNNTSNNTSNNTVSVCTHAQENSETQEKTDQALENCIYSTPEGLLNSSYPDFEAFKLAYLCWFTRLTGKPVNDILQTAKAGKDAAMKFDWLFKNFKRRTVNAGAAIFDTLEVIAQDKACKNNYRFRAADYLDGVISRLVDPALAKTDPVKDEGAGRYKNPTFDYFKY